MKKIIFCGGGTAGHVMPNVALIEALNSKEIEIHYIGGSGIEKDIIKNHPYVHYHEITAPKLIRSFTLKNLAIPFKLLKSINKCKSLLKEIRPEVIFSKGGYISVPVALASKKVPLLGHESDYTMGLANKIIYLNADKMFFSFSDTALHYPKKGEFSGTPIRKCIYSGQNLRKQLNINNSLPIILVVGGSSGSTAINDFFYQNIKALTTKYNIIHITGKNKTQSEQPSTIKNYYQVEYATNIQDYLTTADLVISRAGSNAIFELLALKKLMILIPLPKTQSRGDQILNADHFKENGLCEVIDQEEITVEKLNKTITSMFFNKQNYIKNMKQYNLKNATKTIINEINKYLQ